MKTWLRALVGTIVLVVAIEATPTGRQSFNQQIQAALNAIGYTNSTSQFSQYSKSFVFPAASYLNFGGSFGSSSYGIRDSPTSPGTMQFRNSSGSWTAIPATGGAGGNVKFIVQTPDGTVPNAQALSALSTGIVFNTTTTGVLSTSLLLPAANFPALTGPVTTVAGAVATSITAQAITYGDLQSETASTLLGRGSAGAGSPQEITMGAGMALTGTVLSSTAAAIAGSNTQVQYNNSGAFGASSSFTWTQGSTLLTVAGTTNSTNVLVGNNTPSLTSPKSAAFALNQSWASAFSSTAFDGAQLTTVWNTSGTATGQSESVLIQGSIQGSHAMTGNMYGLHVNLDDVDTGTISESEASRNENTVESGATTTDLYGVTSALKIASGGTSTLLREFYAYTPNVGGTLATEGIEYFGDDPLASGCTKCLSERLDFGSHGTFWVAPTPAAAFAAEASYYGVNLQNTITLNADLGTGSPDFVNFNADVTPSADWSHGAAVEESSYITIHGTHVWNAAVIGGFSGVGSANTTSFTDTSTGLDALQAEWDYGSSGTAALVTGLEIVAGEAGAGVITTGSEIWLQQPYATTGVVTNYAAIQIDNQTWPGSTTDYAILYNAPAGKTFAVVADGTVELAGVTYTWPATAGTSGYVLTTNGSGTLSWGSGIPFPAFAPAGTSTAPSYSWSTAHGVGLYEPSANQTGIVGGVILGKTASAARGSELYISGSGIAPSAAPLEQLDLEPGLDTLQTLVVGQNGYGLYLNPVLSSSASGTNALIANAYFDAGTWTNGGATITEASTVYIAGAPSIGASKYALHVAAGYSRFDGGSGEKVLTVATLPVSPQIGQRADVSDATSPTIGSAVAGSGAAFAAVMWNGSQWTVYSK